MIKHYVNLPIDATKNYGSQVTFVATADSLTENEAVLSEWWIEGDKANTDLKYLSRSARARPQKKYVMNEKNKFNNTVTLPHMGGDKYTVKCSKKGDRANPLKVEEIETWRKIFYTVHYMGNDCLNMFNGVKARLETAFTEGFVEMELVDSSPTRRTENHTKSDNVFSLYKRQPKLRDKPFHLRIVVLNDIYDKKQREYEQVFSGAGTAKGVIGTFYPMSDETADDWRISALAEVAGSPGAIDILGITNKINENTVEFDFTKNNKIIKALQSGKVVTVSLITREREHFLGFSFKNLCVVRINEGTSAARTMQTILQTFTHEIGHGLQQAVKEEQLYDATGAPLELEKNPTWHTDDYGGQGPHCSTNAKRIVDTRSIDEGRTASGEIYTHDSGTLCTMFFRDDRLVDADGKFCVNCLPRLKRVNISAPKMKARGWNAY